MNNETAPIELGLEAFKLYSIIQAAEKPLKIEPIVQILDKNKASLVKAISRLRLKGLVLSSMNKDKVVCYVATKEVAVIRPQDEEDFNAWIDERYETGISGLAKELIEIINPVEVPVEEQSKKIEDVPVPANQLSEQSVKRNFTYESAGAGGGRPTKYNYDEFPLVVGDKVKFTKGKKGEKTTHKGTVVRLMVYKQQKGRKYVEIKPDNELKTTTRWITNVERI